MSAAAKKLLLKDGEHGTVAFLVGAERRAIHGYPAIMAYRSTLMAATDWTAQVEAGTPECYHLLAEYHFSDVQWKLFQSLWLYAHGHDRAFEGVTLTDAMAEQLRGYLGVRDHLAFRLATQHPPTIETEIDRLRVEARALLERLATLPEEQVYDPLTKFDEALQNMLMQLHNDFSISLPYAANLTFPLTSVIPDAEVQMSDWNYKGLVAKFMPAYIRQWVDDTRLLWYGGSSTVEVLYAIGDADYSETIHDIMTVKSTEPYDEFIMPNRAESLDLLRGMLCSPTLDPSTNELVLFEPVRGEDAWNELLLQHPGEQQSDIVEGMMCEVVRIGVRFRSCTTVRCTLLQTNALTRKLIDMCEDTNDQQLQKKVKDLHNARRRVKDLVYSMM